MNAVSSHAAYLSGKSTDQTMNWQSIEEHTLLLYLIYLELSLNNSTKNISWEIGIRSFSFA